MAIACAIGGPSYSKGGTSRQSDGSALYEKSPLRELAAMLSFIVFTSRRRYRSAALAKA